MHNSTLGEGLPHNRPIRSIFAALPVALYHARERSLLSQSFLYASSVGFVLPGPVIALGILAFVLANVPLLYGGMLVLVLAMVVRFLPLAIHAQESAAQQLTPSMEEAARNLGAKTWERLRRVTLPMIRGGIISAWVLVFIDTLKELPATLILRPTDGVITSIAWITPSGSIRKRPRISTPPSAS